MTIKWFDRERSVRVADGLAVALAISLPWSTSATSVVAALWLAAFIPICDVARLRQIALSPAGGLPLLLAALGGVGMLWADVALADRIDGMSSFIKLLFIPLLLCQFSQSDRGGNVLIGFIASSALLLIYSWAFFFWPSLPTANYTRNGGVPLKDYISQGAVFTICIFALARFAVDEWRSGRLYRSLASFALALLFLANVFYIATSRTSLVVVAILIAVFGFRRFDWKGRIGLCAGFLILLAVAWPSASFLQQRVLSFFDEVQAYHPSGEATAAGERMEFWRKSAGFIRAAPFLGHGTGSIGEQFSRSAEGQSGMAGEASVNPHNQILAVGIQLGFAGIAVLLAMWIAHLFLFRLTGPSAWFGLVVVIQNIVGSLFNSHIFDFTHGWIYVTLVGVAGGMALKSHASDDHPPMGKAAAP
jgi:hypothetical protein